MSTNIDAPDCGACSNRRPWADTISALERELRAHEVDWPEFLIVHGRDKRCAETANTALYLMAVDAAGKEARHAKVFHRRAKHFVGLSSVLDGTAFELERLINRCGRPR